jgi:DNA-binding CsgD family transcriptional regulator
MLLHQLVGSSQEPGDYVGLAEPLTAGELRVLRLFAMGISLREISWQLYLTQGAAVAYTRGLTTKLGARSPVEAVARARTLGLLP